MTERVARFSGVAWQMTEALPTGLRKAVHNTAFHLLEEPVPELAEPFPEDGPLPGAYRLHLPSDEITIWYTVTPYKGQEVIIIRRVEANA